MELGKNSTINNEHFIKKQQKRQILLAFLFIIGAILLIGLVSAAPDGYCEEEYSDVHLATWITNVDYELFPTNNDPQSMKITVDFVFTTDGFCLEGYDCQPDPDCNDDYRYVNAWIDWDGDCNFSSTEQVLNEELFWYDEAYQDWLLNTYEGDIWDENSEIWDIIMLPPQNFTGKSIKWYAFDSFAGGIGKMTVSKIISLPDDYENDTWMRVNYGWLYNPLDPCDVLAPTGADPYQNWEWGDATYKQISTTPDLSINSSDISIKQKKINRKFPICDFNDAVLNVTVHNDGKTDVQNIEVLLYKTDSNQNIISSETKTINSIAAENNVTVTFEGNFDPYRFEDIYIELDPENKIWETNESNNEAKTYSIEGYVSQHNLTATNLPRTCIDIAQKIGDELKSVVSTITDGDGFYRSWTNSEYLTQGRLTQVYAYLRFKPDVKTDYRVVNESYFGDYKLPKKFIGNFKNSSLGTIQKDQDYTADITFSGVEGGLAYQTLIDLYQYHKNLNMAPTFVVVNINDDDGRVKNDGNAGAYKYSYTIHLPPGKDGTTNPFIIGHEFTHMVETGWIPIYYDHNPLVPVEEGSCHWGSCVALENHVVEIMDGNGGFVTVDVSNNSHTSNSSPVSDKFTGMREEFQIAGTMWDLNTSLVWKVLRYGFGTFPSPWPSTPLLFYGAYKEIDARSSLVLKAIFQSHAYNTTGWPGKNGLDPDYFTETFSDQGIDTNGNGKYDILQVTAEINIPSSGTYILTGTMDGANVGASNTTYLEVGIHQVNLSFFGENIYESQQSGPYNLSFYLYYGNYTFLDNRLSFYDTDTYSYTEFERPSLVFTGNHFIDTTDDDSDGTTDQLIIDLELNLTENSYVKMYAGLYCNDTFIDNCWGPSMNDDAVYEYIDAGVHNLSLYFNGESIYACRQNGTYELRTYLSNARTISLGMFEYTDFDSPPAILEDIIEEYRLDNDSDGFFDSLNVNISVNGLGTYVLTGNLYNETNAHILTTYQYNDINDTQSICLSFDGASLREQQRSGIYNLTVELYDMNGFFIGWKNYTLSTYQFTDFQPSSEDVFDMTFNDYGIDNTGQYGYETLCIEMDIGSLIPGNYQIEGYLSTYNGQLICSDIFTAYIDTSVTTHTFCFNGQQLGSIQYNGSYTLDLVFINDSDIIELPQIYSTAEYTYDTFEATYVVNTTETLYSIQGLESIPNKLGITVDTYSTVPRYINIKAQLRDNLGDLIDETEIGDIWAFENDCSLLLFAGSKIYDHGIDGPYKLILDLYDENGIFLDSYTSITDYYDHNVFALITFAGLFSEDAYNVDTDPLYDYLRINATVNVAIEGFCTISGVLEDSMGTTITTAENTLWLPKGTQTFPLYFNGTIIKDHGMNGPYALKLVSVYHNKDVTLTDYLIDAYTTQFYDHNDFTLTGTIDQRPVSIASGPIAGSIGESLLFNASASYDPEGHILTYHWDFGDGSTSTDERPTHSYSTNGKFIVNLTVNDGTQESYLDSIAVSIGYPVADAGGPYTIYGIQAHTFDGSGSIDPEDDALTYQWNCGDGTLASGMNPSHTYERYGEYIVTLTVNDGTYESTATTAVTVLKSLSIDDEPTDSGFDTNSDGLFDYLLMEADVTNYVPQNISVEVTLTDSLDTVLSYGVSDQFLNMSSYRLSIYFDGIALFENRVHGPYFVEIIISDDYGEILDSLNYTTTAYEYTDFQYNTKIDTVIDTGLDTNGNGTYDYLSVNVSLISYLNRDVTLRGTLYDSNGTSITAAQETMSLSGNTTIQLLFDGKTIYAHGENGPYTISLTLENEYDQTIDTKESTTYSYQYTDFEEVVITIWTVDDDDGDIPVPPADFSTITDAIRAAADGDEIHVYNGIYYENVKLNKSVTLIGIGFPEINAAWMGHGINVTAEGCVIKGFNISYAYMGDPNIYAAGIYILSSNNSILENSFEENENGISVIGANDNIIRNNTILVTAYNSEVHNIIIIDSKGNIIRENNCLGGGKGITLLGSEQNHVYLNILGNGNYNGYDDGVTNHWNSTNPIDYLFNGMVHNGFVGNYWNDHLSMDMDSDGVYDSPYMDIEGLGFATDYYPMVGNWPPTAQANGPYYAESGQDIQFNSSGSIDPEGETLTYYWDFLDGNTSTDANPMHAYVTSQRLKLYPPLNVSDGVNSDTDTATVYINYPVAVAGGPYYTTEGVSVQLDGSLSKDPLSDPYQSYPLQYYWYPADGSSGSWSISSKKYVSYDNDGEYRPYLQVKTNSGAPVYYSTYSYTTVFVNDTDPIPDFTINQQNGIAPLTIEFTDQSDSYDGITLWEWDFENDGIVDVSGTDDDAQNPSFTYTADGVYSVNLTIHEADNDTVSVVKNDYITVIGSRPPITIYVPDDYPTIQEAIDAGTTIDGDSIIVRDGSYRQNIIVSKELIVKSENGSANCQLYPQYTDDHMVLINSNNVTINGFYMNGTKYSYASLYCGGFENITLSHNWINDTRNGIIFEDVTDSSILNNIIENCSTNSLYGNTISNISIIGNSFSNSGDEGAEFSHMDNCTIKNNTAFGNKYSGILIRSGNDNVLVGNNLNGNGVPGHSSYEDCGLRILSGNNYIIYNNTMNNNSEYGLFLDSSSNIIYNNTMKENKYYDLFTDSDNVVYSNIGSGGNPIIYANTTTHIEDMVVSEIILLGADYSVLSNVTVSGSDILQNNGIYTRRCDNVQFIHVTSNHNYRGIDMTPTFGLSLLVGQDNNTFTHCTFNDNRFDGIKIGGDRNKIENCDTSYNQNYGVNFYECSDSVIVNSTIKNNSWSGIYLRVDYTVFAIENNTITGNSWGIYCTSGDYVGFTEGNVTIEYNLLSNNTADGIRIAYVEHFNSEGDPLHTYLIQHNTILDNDDCGLYTEVEYADLQITMNTIARNDWGISCENTYWDQNPHVAITYNTILENNNGIGITKINDHQNTYLLSDNRIKDNSINGIYISPVSGTINIINNSIVQSSKGILCSHVETTGVDAQVTIDHNIISEDGTAIDIMDKFNEHDYFIINNIIRNNSLFGSVFNAVSDNNTMSDNMIACNHEGIYVNSSETKAIITNNIISNNEHLGININGSDNQLLIYDNIIVDNMVQDIGNNLWNITVTIGQNIIGEPYLGGNYWSTYDGVDNTGDSLGDTQTPYNSSGGILQEGDYHPLVLPQELYLKPLTAQLVFTDTIRSIPLCALGDDSETITLLSDSLPLFCRLTDQGNGIGTIDFLPLGNDGGYYLITINATDGINIVSESFDLQVIARDTLPVTSFTYEPEDPTTLDTIYFNSTSTSQSSYIVDWIWDMGDGTILSGENVTYQFDTEGVYTVCLTVEDTNGFTDSFCISISVESYLGPGNSCDNPIIVEIPSDLNYQDLSQTTCERGNNFEDSNTDYSRGEDIFYRLDVTEDAMVIIKMIPYEDYTGLFLYDECPENNPGADWLLKATDITSNPRTFTVTLTADNSPYYLIADSWPSPDCYDFDLYIYGYADILVQDIVSPQNGTEIGVIPIQLQVENNGSTDETGIPVNVNIGRITGIPVTYLSEGFEGAFPPIGWTIQIHDATTFAWEQWAYSNASYSFTPQGTGDYYAMTQDYTTPGYYLVNTSLFTKSLDLTGVSDVSLSFEQCFHDKGYGKSEVRTHSGGILEEVLFSQQTDDIPLTDHITLHFDPSTYIDPSNVTIEFWYSDENVWSTSFGFAIDDVLICSPASTETVYDETVTIDLFDGETSIVDTFPDWTVTTVDTYQIKACVQFNDDMNPDNDCLLQTIQLVEQSGDQPPYVPNTPYPNDGAVSVPLGNESVLWYGGDPDSGDEVIYTVYFGTESTPPYRTTVGPFGYDVNPIGVNLVVPMTPETTYYWQIVAEDSHGEQTIGPIWNFTTIATSTGPVHNINTGEEFTTIQEAIDDVDTLDGHLISVDPGVYNENVNVTKELNIISTSHSFMDTVITAFDSTLPVITINANATSISGFSLTGSTGSQGAGIYLYGKKDVSISDNNLSGNYYGLNIVYAGTIYLLNNNASFNLYDGISVITALAGNCTVINNAAISNQGSGITVHISSAYGDCNVSKNIVKQNTLGGLGVGQYQGFGHCSVTDNWVEGNGGGLDYVSAKGGPSDMYSTDYVINNTIVHNGGIGLPLDLRHSNYIVHIKNNNISYNDAGGMMVSESSGGGSIVTGNIVEYNGGPGINGSLSNGGFLDGLFYIGLQLENNSFNHNDGPGIVFMDLKNGGSVPIKNNKINDNNGSGIVIPSAKDGGPNSIEDNSICNNQGMGIELVELMNGGFSPIARNTIMNNEGWNVYFEWDIYSPTQIGGIGILQDYSAGYPIYDNIINSNNGTGLFMYSSQSGCGLIEENTINDNQGDGISIGFSEARNRVIRSNILDGNSGSAIKLNDYENWYTVTNNTCTNNMYGILLNTSGNNTIFKNDFSNNTYGVFLISSVYNTFYMNTCNFNQYGVSLVSSAENTFMKNIIKENIEYGFDLDTTNNNLIYLNTILNNGVNAHYFTSSTDLWNSTEEITYLYQGNIFTNYLGNYWSDYTGIDTDGDGIGNTPHPIDANMDYRPLVDHEEEYITLADMSVHNIDTGENFSLIQDAIDAVNTTDGHTLVLDPRTFVETVTVNKELTIQSSSGNPEDTIIIGTDPSSPTFTIVSDNVVIDGLGFIGPTDWAVQAVYLNNVNNCSIIHTVVSGFSYGIYQEYSNNTIFKRNSCYDNNRGIHIYYSSNTTFEDNNVSSNGYSGISMSYSDNSTIRNNTANGNTFEMWGGVGLYLSYVSNTIIENNTVCSNDVFGIYAHSSSNHNYIANNTANDNGDSGISLQYQSRFNTIRNNTIERNKYGIYLWTSSNNTFLSNWLTSNEYGIYLMYSNSNVIYNNYLNNTNNVYDAGTNIYNITKTRGTNIIDGPYLGGNYWHDYTGEDTDDDGLGDTEIPFAEFGGIQMGGDYHPLVSTSITPPFTDFSFNPINPTPLNLVQFTDLSTDDGVILNWTWDLGDGNTSYEQHPDHQYSSSGEYQVCLTVTDDDDLTDTRCKTVMVTEQCYTLTIAIEGNGVVQIDPEESCYLIDTVVNLTLSSDAGWLFEYWSGAGSEDLIECNDGSWQIVMDDDKELTAHFSEIQTPPCNPDIVLPTGHVTMFAWEFPDDLFGAYRIEIDGITGTLNVSDGTYPGWCVDFGTPISKGYEHPHNVTLYSSYNPPANLTHDNWSLVNYVINHVPNDAEPVDVQRAIYYLINYGPWSWNYTGYEPMGDEVDYGVVNMIITDAVLYGDSWCPSCGDTLAVICDPGVEHPFQITFIEVVLCMGNDDEDIDNEAPINDPSGKHIEGSSRPDPLVLTNQHPSASAVVDNAFGFPGLVCTFNASSSYDPDGRIVEYQWDFDGSSVVTTNTTVTYSFQSVGYHQVMLTVVDDTGLTDGLEEVIIIEIISANNPPGLPTVGLDMNYVHKESVVNFTINSVDTDEGDMIYFMIDWGDEQNETTQYYNNGEVCFIGHQWRSYGVYTVTVYAIDTENATSPAATFTMYVDVHVIDDKIVGWLIDTDGDGNYDVYKDSVTDGETPLEKLNQQSYLIDISNDAEWDYSYEVETGTLEKYDEAYDVWIFVVIVAVILLIFFTLILYRRSTTENKMSHK